MTPSTVRELGSCFEFVRNGMNVKQSKDVSGVPITRIETISDGTVNLSKVGYAGLECANVEKWLLEPGDILFSHINSVEHVGKCALFEGSESPVAHGMNLLCLRPKISELWPAYAKWLLKSPRFRSQIMPFINKAVNQASLSTKNLKSIEILLPRLSEQKQIAAILDQADDIRRLRQRAHDRLGTLGQSIFCEMFGDPATNQMGWQTGQLNSLVTANDKINYGVVQPGENVTDGVPLIRAGDLSSPVINVDLLKKIDAHIENSYSRSRLKGDEILVGCVGSIGAIALAGEMLRGANIARAVGRVPIDKNKADRNFIAQQLRMPSIQNYFRSEVRAVAQPTLNIKQLKETPIFLPPLEGQRKFSKSTAKIERTRLQYVAHIAALDGLFASLQQRAFRGEL